MRCVSTTATSCGVVSARASTGSCSRWLGNAAAVSFTSVRRARCAPGSRFGALSSHASSVVASLTTRSANEENASAASPSGNTSSRTSHASSTPPACSTTWQSSQTCGVWVTPCTNRPSGGSVVGSAAGSVVAPAAAPVAVPAAAPVPMVLVNTTGIRAGRPWLRVSSASTSKPEKSRWSRSSKSWALTADTRPANVDAASRSTASRFTEVKSPTTDPIRSCSGSRLNTGRFSVNRRCRFHRPTVSA